MASPERSSGWERLPLSLRSREAVLFAWLGLLMLAHRATFGFRGARATSNPIESYFFETGATVPLLHYAVFAFVVWQRRHALAAFEADRAPGAPRVGSGRLLVGGATLLAGAALAVWGELAGQVDLQLDSLVLLIGGGALWRGGPRLLDRFLLPLAVLWLARPMPPIWVHAIHEWMQSLTGWMAGAALSPFDAVVQSGHLMSFQGHVFHVIEGCSGFRSTLTLIFATLFYAEIFSRSRRQTLGLVALAVGVGLLVNGLRVVWIMLQPGSEVSRDHSAQGLVMIVVGMLAVAALDAWLDRWLWPRGDRSWRGPDPDAPAAPVSIMRLLRDRWIVPLGLAVLLVVASFVPVSIGSPRSEAWQLHEIGVDLGAWHRSRVREVDYEHLGSVDFRDKVYRDYVRGEDRVTLFVASDDRTRRDRSLISPKTLTEGSGWEIEERTTIELPDLGRPADRIIARRGDEEALSIHLRLGLRGPIEESIRWLLALDRWPGRSPAEIAVVRVTVPIVDRDRVGASQVAQSFLADLVPALRRAAPSSLLLEEAPGGAGVR